MEEKNSVWGYILVAVVTIVIGVGIGLGISYFTKEDKEPNVVIDNNSNWEDKNNISCSNEEIKLLLTSYLDLEEKNKHNTASILEKFKLLPVDGECLECSQDQDENGYTYSKALYSEFKNSMLLYMTEDLFEIEFADNFKEENGFIKYYDVYLSPGYRVEVENINNISGNEFMARVTKIVIDNAPQPTIFTGNIKFEIKQINNKCVISSIEDK